MNKIILSLKYIACYVFILVGYAGMIAIVFKHPDETNARLLINHWREYLVYLFFAFIGMVIFIKIERKK